MLVMLPFATFAIIMLTLTKRAANDAGQPVWRRALLAGSLIWAAFLTLITELLSLLHALTVSWVSASWLIVLIGAIIYFSRSPGRAPRPRVAPGALLAVIAVIVVITGITAVIAPPNTWDSMTYHMARVVHWIQNQGVQHYPTHVARQIALNPGAEFAITHLQLLTGGDRLANLVQWFSMMGCLVGVSLLARELGAGSRGQSLAVLFAATLPMGILQASSTQNDYAVAFWLVCLAYWVVRSRSTGLKGLPAAAIGTSLALALLTKGTAYLYALPFMLWLLVIHWPREKWRLWRPLLTVAVLCLSLNIGYWTRNTLYSGNPLGTVGDYPNSSVDPRPLASNVIRNLALHLAMPSETWNAGVERAVASIHGLLRVSVNDPRTTYPGVTFQVVGGDSDETSAWMQNLWQVLRQEDHAGNPLHLVCILLAVIVCVRKPQLRRGRQLALYTIAATAAFLVFCGFLKWQPWHSRLHLAVFVLFSPLIGVIADRLQSRKTTGVIASVLFLAALPWLLGNTTRPLVGGNNIFQTGRMDQYLASKPELNNAYREAARFIAASGWSELGLVISANSGEYPLWTLLHNKTASSLRIRHVYVPGESDSTLFEPQAIIEISNRRQLPGNFIPVFSSGPVRILVPSGE